MPSRPHHLLSCALVLLASGSTLAGQTVRPGYESDLRNYNLAHGRVVFSERCLRCHETGRRDAPVIGDAGDWRTRIEQPLDTLIRHAIEGHGRMPARGDQEINDQDIASAVAYVVSRSRVIVAVEGGTPPSAEAAEPTGAQQEDPADQAVMQMFLLLLGKDRWK